MEHPNYAQDLYRCHHCDNPLPSLLCDICEEYLCEACKGEHLLDLSKEHEVLPLRGRECSPRCQRHFSKICERYCIQCAIPICVECASSKEHKRHEIRNKTDFLNGELQELENQIFPIYQEIACRISDQKTKLNENSQKLITAINKHGEDLHREIDTNIQRLTTKLNEMDSECLAVLNNQENEIMHRISKATQIIAYLKKLIALNDDSRVFVYKSRNAKFIKFPPKLTVTLPNFTPHKVMKEKIYQQFGSLSAFSIKKEEHGYTINSLCTKPLVSDRPHVAVSKVIAEINTDYGHSNELRSVSCLTDEDIWTCGNKNIMKLYNLQGNLVKSIKTKSGNNPQDIAVTRTGDLIYTDYNDRTVNVVRNTQIETVIRRRGWIPTNFCRASSGDLLVVMESDCDKQTKVVRYSGSTEKQIIQYNDDKQSLFSSYGVKFISENRNLDICVSDYYAHAVVVVNQNGKLRFTYTGPPSSSKKSFIPYGIATDSQSRILTADHSTFYIHILDQDGQFLCLINNCHLDWPYGLCVDTKDNLYVVESFKGKVKKIHYNL